MNIKAGIQQPHATSSKGHDFSSLEALGISSQPCAYAVHHNPSPVNANPTPSATHPLTNHHPITPFEAPVAPPSPAHHHHPHLSRACRTVASSRTHSDWAGVSFGSCLDPSPGVNGCGSHRSRAHARARARACCGPHRRWPFSRPRNRNRSRKSRKKRTTRRWTRLRRGGGGRCSILFSWVSSVSG